MLDGLGATTRSMPAQETTLSRAATAMTGFTAGRAATACSAARGRFPDWGCRLRCRRLLGRFGTGHREPGSAWCQCRRGGGRSLHSIEGLVGSAFANTLSGGAASTAFGLGAGADLLRDRLADLDGDRISRFGLGDTLDNIGSLMGRANLAVTTGAGAVTIGARESSFKACRRLLRRPLHDSHPRR